MKYKQYVLTFTGDPEAVAFLKRKVARTWPRLGPAREAGRAAAALFDVEYAVTPVERARVAGKVKSL